MKNIFKKTVIMLAIILGVSCFSIACGCKHEYVNGVCVQCGEVDAGSVKQTYEYRLIDGGEAYELSKYNGSEKEVVIPENYNGKPIKRIGTLAFAFCESIEKVSFDANSKVEVIDQHAFEYCNRLTEITLPLSLKEIGEFALAACPQIRQIHLPENVEKVGDRAFYGDYELQKITVAEDNQHYKHIDDNLYTKDGKMLIMYAIGKRATEFTIPEGVETIYARAVYDCDYLESVTIPSSVKVIEKSAFYISSKISFMLYQGTLEEFSNVSLGGYWIYGTSLVEVVCDDGSKPVDNTRQ